MPQQGQKVPPMASSAWISPTGDFIYVKYARHFYVAEEILGDPDIQAKGWLHLSGGRCYFDRKPTQAQIDTLFDVSMAYHNHPNVDARGESGDEIAFEMKTLDNHLSRIIEGIHSGGYKG